MPAYDRKFQNFNEWFDETLLKARIVDKRFPVKGFLVYLENGTFILKKVRELLERELEKTGHKEMMFPLVIASENFSREAEHVKILRRGLHSK